MNTRTTTTAGVAPVIVLFFIAGALGLTWVAAPSVFPGTAANRAAVSKAATGELLTAQTERAATAAAKVVKIQEANTAAAPSPAREFIALESASALSDLPPPNAAALIEAEKRRTAIFAGERDEARRLYGLAAMQSEKRAAALAEATAARQAADVALIEAAAREHRANLWALGLLFIATAAGAAALWFKIHFGGIPSALGRGIAELKANHPAAFSITEPILARYLNRAEQARVAQHTGL